MKNERNWNIELRLAPVLPNQYTISSLMKTANKYATTGMIKNALQRSHGTSSEIISILRDGTYGMKTLNLNVNESILNVISVRLCEDQSIEEIFLFQI